VVEASHLGESGGFPVGNAVVESGLEVVGDVVHRYVVY
jgi:hypothetical protein